MGPQRRQQLGFLKSSWLLGKQAMVASRVADTATAATEVLVGPTLTLTSVLAVVATTLLVFVSVGVMYLSTVEWRDRRRRSGPSVRS